MPQEKPQGTTAGFDLLAAIVASSDDSILSMTTEGVITSANAGAERLYGYGAGELIGKPLSALVPDTRWGEDKRLLDTVVHGGSVDHFDTQRLRKDGTLVDVSVSLSPVHDESGRVVAVSSIARDISERRAHAAELERLDRLRSEFVSKVSHELRNPLATIRGLASLLASERDLDAGERTRFGDAIVRQADHLVKLVDDLLQVSQMDAGGFSYAFIEFDLESLVREAVEFAKVAHSDHAFTLGIHGSLPPMHGDPERISQVVANLLANASNYSPAGTPVAVSAIVTPGGVEIAVEDQGVGIAADDIANLFTRFGRLKPPGYTEVKGTGLGLYISKAIVEAHGGRIIVRSAPGRGSTFTVVLPARPSG